MSNSYKLFESKSDIAVNLSSSHINRQIKIFCEKHKADFEFPKSILSNVENSLHDGYVSRYLIAKQLQKEDKKLTLNDVSDNFRSNPPPDDLNTLRLQLETISRWDGSRKLSEKEKFLFCSLLNQICYFHFSLQRDDITPGNLQQLVYKQNHEASEFIKEKSYGLCFTEAQLNHFLSKVLKPNRMIYVGTQNHSLAIYSGSKGEIEFYNSHSSAGWKTLPSTQTLAKEIFDSHKPEPMNYDPARPSPFDIRIFIHEEQKSECYPIAVYLMDELKLQENFDEKYAGGVTSSHMAAKNSSYDSLMNGIDLANEAKVSCDRVDSRNNTPLYFAAWNNNMRIANLLLTNKADPNIQFSNRFSPLHVAAWGGHCDVLETLLKHKADPNIKSSEGITPLMFAAGNGKAETIDMLLEQKADINAISSTGLTALHYAIDHHQVETVFDLLTSKADPNVFKQPDGTTVLTSAILNSNTRISEALLYNGANPNEERATDGMTPLIAAAQKNEYKLMYKLLKQGAKADAKLKNGKSAANISSRASAVIEIHHYLQKNSNSFEKHSHNRANDAFDKLMCGAYSENDCLTERDFQQYLSSNSAFKSCYHLYQENFIDISQKHIINKLLIFYDKYKNIYDFPGSLNEVLNGPGLCMGLSIRFLMGINMQKSTDEKPQSLDDISDDCLHYPPPDNLSTFLLSLRTISIWDGKSELNAKERFLFSSLLNHVTSFQGERPRMSRMGGDIHKLLYRVQNNECKPQFQLETSYAACFTKQQLQQFISRIVKPCRMIILSTHNHAMGLFKTALGDIYFYDANNKLGWKKISNESDDGIWFSMYVQTRSSPWSIKIYINSEQKPEEYPSAKSLFTELKLEDNVDPEYAAGESGLSMSIFSESMSSFKFHLQSANDSRILSNCAIEIAKRNNVTMLNMLAEKLQKDYKPQSLLTTAAEWNADDIVKKLITEKADVNGIEAGTNVTSLYYAALNGHSEIAQLLLEKKADPDLSRPDGCTPLFAAAGCHHRDIVELLLKNGADLKKENKYHETALNYAKEPTIHQMCKTHVSRNSSSFFVKMAHSISNRFHDFIFDNPIKNRKRKWFNIL